MIYLQVDHSDIGKLINYAVQNDIQLIVYNYVYPFMENEVKYQFSANNINDFELAELEENITSFKNITEEINELNLIN
jgi:hypothetical protein